MTVPAARINAAAQRRELRICMVNPFEFVGRAWFVRLCRVHSTAVGQTKVERAKKRRHERLPVRGGRPVTQLTCCQRTGDSLPSPTAISTPYYRFRRLQIPKSKYFGGLVSRKVHK